MVTLHTGEDEMARFRFLARWSLLASLVVLGLLLMFFTVLFPVVRDSPLPAQYNDLVRAGRNPAIFRLSIALTAAHWLLLGGFLLLLGAALAVRAPIGSAFIWACGIGQIAGVTGAFIHLNAVSNLAAGYAAAGPEQQGGLLRSYDDLRLVGTSLYAASDFMSALALLVVAGVTISAAGTALDFPRWLVAMCGLLGLFGLGNAVADFATGSYAPDVPSDFLRIVIFFAVAVVFWRRTRAEGLEARQVPAS